MLFQQYRLFIDEHFQKSTQHFLMPLIWWDFHFFIEMLNDPNIPFLVMTICDKKEVMQIGPFSLWYAFVIFEWVLQIMIWSRLRLHPNINLCTFWFISVQFSSIFDSFFSPFVLHNSYLVFEFEFIMRFKFATPTSLFLQFLQFSNIFHYSTLTCVCFYQL